MKKPSPPPLYYVTEGEDPRKKHKKEKVYCDDCKWYFDPYLIDIKGPERCECPNNKMKLADTHVRMGHVSKKPSILNKNNDCKWHKRKWWMRLIIRR